MIQKLLIYISSEYKPYKNLAVEKYLTDTCPQDTMILYLWQNDNTIVIGQNQNPYTECSPDGGELYIARRLSGGGAVYHDKGNLNFSFITPADCMNVAFNMKIIKKACSMAGIETELSGRNDLLAGGRKFSGNAFYNSGSNSYHHGTLMIDCDIERMTSLLTPPRAKLDAKGIKSVRSRVINLSELKQGLDTEAMKDYMIKAAEELLSTKAESIKAIDESSIKDNLELYSSDEYIYGKTPPFTAEAEGHFDWGNVRILLEVKKNIISSAKIYTDSMDWSLGDKFQRAVTGCVYDSDKLLQSLNSVMPADMAGDLARLIK